MAEIQTRSQSPISFRQVEDGDRCCQSDLGTFDDKTGESEVIWQITFAIYLSANSNGLLSCLLLWIFWSYWILVNKISFWKQ